MRYTHFYNLLYQVLILGGSIILLATAGDAFNFIIHPAEGFIEDLISQAKHFFIAKDYEWVANVIQFVTVIIGIILFFSVFFGSVFLLAKTVLPPYLSTYCYVNYTLGTKVDTIEASKLSFLFDGDLGGVWYPLRSLRKLDPEFRREALFAIANEIAAKHRLYPPFPPKQKQERKSDEQQYRRSEGQDHAGSSQGSQPQIDPQTAEYLGTLGFENMPANHEILRSAYLVRLKEFHPDKFATERTEIVRLMEEKTKKINLAYEYLCQHFRNGADR